MFRRGAHECPRHLPGSDVQKLLLQLDSSVHPSVFDRVVAFDSGADQVMSYGSVTPDAVRDLVHGTLFTRASPELRHTAIFIGGADMATGERLLEAALRERALRARGPVLAQPFLHLEEGEPTAAALASPKVRVAVPVH